MNTELQLTQRALEDAKIVITKLRNVVPNNQFPFKWDAIYQEALSDLEEFRKERQEYTKCAYCHTVRLVGHKCDLCDQVLTPESSSTVTISRELGEEMSDLISYIKAHTILSPVHYQDTQDHLQQALGKEQG